MIQNKLVIGTNASLLQNTVDTLTEDGWLVIVGSVGGMYSGARNDKLLMWVILEKETV